MWLVVQRNAKWKTLIPEAKNDLDVAFHHSRRICDVSLTIESLKDLFQKENSEFYVYQHTVSKEYAMIEAKFKHSLKAIDISIYIKPDTKLEYFLKLFERSGSLACRMAIKMSWEYISVDVYNEKAAKNVVRIMQDTLEMRKVYDDYYICSGNVPHIKRREILNKYGDTNWYDCCTTVVKNEASLKPKLRSLIDNIYQFSSNCNEYPIKGKDLTLVYREDELMGFYYLKTHLLNDEVSFVMYSDISDKYRQPVLRKALEDALRLKTCYSNFEVVVDDIRDTWLIRKYLPNLEVHEILPTKFVCYSNLKEIR